MMLGGTSRRVSVGSASSWAGDSAWTASSPSRTASRIISGVISEASVAPRISQKPASGAAVAAGTDAAASVAVNGVPAARVAVTAGPAARVAVTAGSARTWAVEVTGSVAAAAADVVVTASVCPADVPPWPLAPPAAAAAGANGSARMAMTSVMTLPTMTGTDVPAADSSPAGRLTLLAARTLRTVSSVTPAAAILAGSSTIWISSWPAPARVTWPTPSIASSLGTMTLSTTCCSASTGMLPLALRLATGMALMSRSRISGASASSGSVTPSSWRWMASRRSACLVP
jgi:hypothetical protein